jgi:glycosyltransferase involved in cell wall biosynthesis
MKKIREVTLFTNGDSTRLRTWSNFPYFFSKTLESKGIKVNRVNISPNRTLNLLSKLFYEPVLKKIYSNTSYTYFRSKINFLLTRRRIKNAVIKYSSSDADIFLTFSFSSTGFTNKPIIQLCDWTYDYHIKNLDDRKPDKPEQKSIRREDSQIEGSDILFLIFSSIHEHMITRYKKSTHFFGQSINNMKEPEVSRLMKRKKVSKRLLFIGNKRYLEGANYLIGAFEILKKNIPDLHLDIVALNNQDFKYIPAGVTCHGYLDKGDSKECELLYSLIEDAKVFVNTTPKVGSFSAAVESLFFYTPIVTTPYDDFVKTFGREINFGYLCEDYSVELLAGNLNKIFEDPDYEKLCFSAHEAVKNLTWDYRVDQMLKIIQEFNKNQKYL